MQNGILLVWRYFIVSPPSLFIIIISNLKCFMSAFSFVCFSQSGYMRFDGVHTNAHTRRTQWIDHKMLLKDELRSVNIMRHCICAQRYSFCEINISFCETNISFCSTVRSTSPTNPIFLRIFPFKFKLIKIACLRNECKRICAPHKIGITSARVIHGSVCPGSVGVNHSTVNVIAQSLCRNSARANDVGLIFDAWKCFGNYRAPVTEWSENELLCEFFAFSRILSVCPNRAPWRIRTQPKLFEANVREEKPVFLENHQVHQTHRTNVIELECARL